jgi:hypothetical protein
MELKAKPKAKKGRPAKYLNPEKAFEWFDESAFEEAKKKRQEWEDAYINLKAITGTEFETLNDFEQDLRKKYPELSKLDINQLYIMEGKDRTEIGIAFSELRFVSKPSLAKDDYTVKIPAEKANEYSHYLSIAEAFNNIRAEGNNSINIAQIPNITGSRIVLDSRSMKLRVNAYRFTKGYK